MVIINTKTTKKENNKNNNTTEEDIIEEQINIDMNNLKNSEIIDGQKVNTSKKIKEEHKVVYDINSKSSSLVINDMQLYSDSEYDLADAKFVLKNTGNTTIKKGYIFIFLEDSKGIEIHQFTSEIEDLNAGEEVTLSYTNMDDFIVAYDYRASYLEY